MTILFKIIDEELEIEIPHLLFDEVSEKDLNNKSKLVIESLEFISNFVLQHSKNNEEYFDEIQMSKESAGCCIF